MLQQWEAAILNMSSRQDDVQTRPGRPPRCGNHAADDVVRSSVDFRQGGQHGWKLDSQARSATTTLDTTGKATARLLFVDDIRIYLTILVILHHLMVIYAGTGNRIYTEGRQDTIVDALGGWFCATNQAYFMGLFLLMGAYFVPSSYDRKIGGRFLKNRLIRLGIPLAVYS